MPDPMTATALARLLDPLLTLARHQGMDSDQLLAMAELDQERLQKPGARFPAHHYTTLLEHLADSTGNPLVALRLGEATQPRMLGSAGFLMATAATLQDAYQVLIDYLPLLYEGAVLQLEQTVEGSWLTLELNDAARKPTEYFLACLVNWPRSLTGHQIPATRLELSFPAPPDPQAWERFFAAEVQFDAPHNRVLLASDYLSLSCLDANDEMHQLHREFADSVLSHSVQRSALIAQTRNLIRRQLAEGDGLVRREQVAEAVNLSLRTLQRKLGQLGTSFQEVYDQTRREHCLQLIQRGQYSFGEIAFRLGFSNQSAFQKAFKRWMGVAPSQYRAQLKTAVLQHATMPQPATAQASLWYQQTDIEQELTQRLAQLSDFSGTLLQWAALCGTTFDLNLLASASDNPLARLVIHIWPAQQQELIEPVEEAHNTSSPVQFRFTHPDIQRTMLALQSERRQQQRHLRLARATLTDENTSAAQQLHHLNHLQRLPPELKQQRLQLNRETAERCTALGEYSQAISYWQQLLRLLPADNQADTQLALADTLLQARELSRCQQQLQTLSDSPLTISQRAQRAQLQAQLLQAQQQPEQALPLLCEALALLDQPLPDSDTEALTRLLHQLQQIEQHPDLSRLHSPATTQPASINQIMYLCEQISLLAQQLARPLLAACAISRMVELSLQYGHGAHTPFACVSYAWVASWFCGDEPLARRFSAEGLMLAERYQQHDTPQPVAATAWLILGNRVSHWFNPLSESRQQLQQARSLCPASSPLLSQIDHADANLSWLTGTPLPELAAQMPPRQNCADSAGWLIEQLNQPQPLQLPAEPQGWQAVAAASAALILDEQDLWPQLFQLETRLEQQMAGSYGLAELLFSTGLMKLILAQPLRKLVRRRAEQIAQLESRLEHWARHAPDNFSTPLTLIRAEQARLARAADAAQLFEQAIAYSEQQPAMHHRALCYERYADYLLAQQQSRLAGFCLQEAQRLYQHWGAGQKVKLLAATITGLAQ